jgi:hypothetical protein
MEELWEENDDNYGNFISIYSFALEEMEEY